MKVLIRIQKVYKNLTKRSLQICWDDEQTPGSPISSPTHQEDFEKRVSMTLIISYLALILNFTIAISTIYFLLNDLLPKWILPRQSVYRDSVNDHRKMKKCFRIFRGQQDRQQNSYQKWSAMNFHPHFQSSTSFDYLCTFQIKKLTKIQYFFNGLNHTGL